mgnify:CR=1 FL=1
MIKSVFERVNIPMFNRFLDASTTQQKVVAENMANIHTPGYKAKDVDFAQVLKTKTGDFRNEGKRTHERHLVMGANSKYDNVNVDEDQTLELDSVQNNVDIDYEMVKSAKNQLFYAATSKIVFGKFKALHTSIKGR